MALLSNRRVFSAMVWQPLRAQIGRTVLAVVAIALGVALGLAIFLMTRAATAETARASRSLFGQADYVIQGTAEGFDEALYPVIARIPGIALATPVVEARVLVIGKPASLIIIGRDFLLAARSQAKATPQPPQTGLRRASLDFLNADVIQLSTSAAQVLQVSSGDTMTIQVGLQPVRFKVATILPSNLFPQNVGLMDIAAAQWNLDKLGLLTRIELTLDPSVDSAATLAAIQNVLPAHVKLNTPRDESHQVEQLLRPITVNLMGVALVALFTGVFLVYSSQSLAIVRRRREFALLHALGVTPREQIASVLYSGATLGSIGALLGVVLGVALAKVGLQFSPGGATQLHLEPIAIAVFALLGVLASVAGSVAPALAAASIPTAQALKAGNCEERSKRGHSYLALLLWLFAVPLLRAPAIFELPLLGYTAIAFILFGAVLLIPPFTRTALALLPQRRRVSYQVALAQLRGVAHTATTSVATMLVSVSLMVAMAIMGASLRDSMMHWTNQLWPADLVVQIGSGSTLDAAAIQTLTSTPGIARTETTRFVPILLAKNKPPVTLAARAIESLPIETRAQHAQPADAVPIWINRALADREQLAVDDVVAFPLAGQIVQGSVRGVWRDYFNPNGMLAIDYKLYRQRTHDERVSSLSLWVTPGVAVETTRGLLRERLGAKVVIDIALPGEMRARVLRGFDSLFAIIYVLLAVAVLIGLFGIGVNASAQVLARRAEFGVLRHLGCTRAQIGAVVSIEGLTLGTLGVVAGLIVGSVISAVMIYVVTPQSFHWTMDLHVPTTTLLALTFVVPAASAGIALWSGRSAMSDDVVGAVKEDW